MTSKTSLCDRMKALRAQGSELTGHISELRRSLQNGRGVPWMETYTHLDVAPLVARSMEIPRELASLEAQIIRENLARFGIEDPQVTAKLDIARKHGGATLRTVEMGPDLLSNFCLPFGVWPTGELSTDEEARLKMAIFLGGEQVGYVDSDGQFNFTAAPNLRVCVGWAVATDWGRQNLLDGYNLDYEVNKLEYAVREAPPLDGSADDLLRHYFLNGVWNFAVLEAMAYEKGSRFGNGHCAVKTLYWMVATRTIRERLHAGFPFIY